MLRLRRQGYEDPASIISNLESFNPSGNSANVPLTLSTSIKVLTTFRPPLSCQFLQQDLGFFEVRGVETLREPTIDVCEQLVSFSFLALLLP